MGKTIKRVSDEPYSGWDGLEPLNLEPGEEAEVSDEKAAQLAADFPHDFEIEGAKAPSRRSKPAAPAAEPEEPAAVESEATPAEQEPKPASARPKRVKRARRKS